MNKQLTIVIPVRNRAHCVRRTLDSVAAATPRPDVLLIIDNASTDATHEVCQEWAESNHSEEFEIQVITEIAPGANAARNRGLQECRTPYINFFDSDDEFAPDAIAEFRLSLSKRQEEETERMPALFFLPVRQELNGQTATRAFRISTAPQVHILNAMLSTASMIFRTEWLRQIGGWNPDLSIWQDWELGVRVMLAQPMVCWLTHRAFHLIHIHPESITGASLSHNLEGIQRSMRQAIADVRQATLLAHREQQRALRALFFRIFIIAGKLRHEHNKKGAVAFRQLAHECMPHAAKPLRAIGLMLEGYSALGGRGAWKMALALC